MRERPILFSSSMVRALLAGTKTQTRRIVKYTPALGEPAAWPAARTARWLNSAGAGRYCPYGHPGDRLWVRETWCLSNPEFADECPCDGRPTRLCGDGDSTLWAWYAATDEGVTSSGERADGSERSPWRSPIYMPRWASRITLEITGVRVERVQDITEEDARAEGVEEFARAHCAPGALAELGAVEVFHIGWHGIHGDGAWERNPWVWCVSFKVVQP